MEVRRSYIVWSNEIQKCAGYEPRVTTAKVRVYSQGDRTVVLVSKGMRFDLDAKLEVAYKGLNCVVIRVGWGDSSGCLVFTETGADLFWSSFIQDWAEVTNTQILVNEVQVAGLEYHEGCVKCIPLSGDVETLSHEEDKYECSTKSLQLTETVEEVEDPEEKTVKAKIWEWFKNRPGVLGFGISLIWITVVLTGVWFKVFYKPTPKAPVVDPFVLEEDDWQFPEAREHPYPDFAFLDKYDPDDEYGVTTKMNAPVPRTMTEAKKLNEDVKGWIKVPGTAISYPVLYTDMGNSYYLNRNILKQQVLSGNTDGVIFADTNCVLDNRGALKSNTVVYGHNWTNRESGSEKARVNNPEDKQFAPLISFSDSNFAHKYRRVVLTTNDGTEQQFAIFAVFYIDVAGSEFFQYNAVDAEGEELDELIEKAKAASLYEYPVSVSSTDKLITLSTCSVRYSKTGSGRFVVMGKLMDSKARIPTSALKVK